MKTKILCAFAIALITLLIFSCKDEKVLTEIIDPRLMLIVGDYYTTKFILPSELDAPVDILKLGGFITLNIKKDKTISGRYFVPKTYNHMQEDTDYIYSGTIEFISQDTLRMIGTRTFLSTTGFNFQFTSDSLVARVFAESSIETTFKRKY